MLAVARRLRESQNRMLAGNWSILTSSDLSGKTVRIIGLGRIGKSLVQRLKGFETRILVCHPRPDREYGEGQRHHLCRYADAAPAERCRQCARSLVPGNAVPYR